MANHHRYLTPLLSLLLVSSAAAAGLTSFSHDFSSSNLAAGEFTFQGDVTVIPRGGYHLTQLIINGGPGKNSVGRILLSEPIQFWTGTHQLDFETSLRFGMYPYDSTPAEGITFFIAPVGTQIPEGSAGGYLGVFSPEGSNSNTIAVEFDSFYNRETDGPMMPHIGIDIESPQSSNFTYVGSAMISQEVTAIIAYKHETKLLTVTVYAANQVFTVSYVIDLSTVLTPRAQIGVSGATGENVSFQYLRFWEFRSMGYVPISTTQTV